MLSMLWLVSGLGVQGITEMMDRIFREAGSYCHASM